MRRVAEVEALAAVLADVSGGVGAREHGLDFEDALDRGSRLIDGRHLGERGAEHVVFERHGLDASAGAHHHGLGQADDR